MGDVWCPYCDSMEEINHDDGYGYSEDRTYSQECSSCDKTFTYSTSIMYHYDVDKAPCLNGEDHKWGITMTIPRFFCKMRCEWCDEERELTEDEKVKHDIPKTP